jgi:hypothetical protein
MVRQIARSGAGQPRWTMAAARARIAVSISLSRGAGCQHPGVLDAAGLASLVDEVGTMEVEIS